jgi:hypothetical protein
MRTAQRPSFTGAAFADAPHSATLDAMAIAIALIPFAPGFADAGASGMTRSRRAADRIVIVMDGLAPHELPRSRRDIISCGVKMQAWPEMNVELGRYYFRVLAALAEHYLRSSL